MRTIAEMNPIAVTVYFLAVTGICMFTMDPLICALSLIGALSYHFTLNGLRNPRFHLYALLLFLGMALINPLVSHNGMTVLFVINDSPITLEALYYGLTAAGMILAVLYWFGSYTRIMTSDRLLYLFGALSPRFALLISMALRYIPLMEVQIRRTSQAQKALGLSPEESFPDRVRARVRVFSVMVTWALENGIITADSMSARGYGAGRRSRFSIFRFLPADALLLLMTLFLAIPALFAALSAGFVFYPAIRFAPATPFTLAGYLSYALLVFLPPIIHAKELLRWKFLRSGI